MRENIGLFRGKSKNKSDYYFFSQNWKESCKDGFAYGSLVVAHGRYYICVSALCKVNCCVNNSLGSMIEVIPETVGQYTGLTDKNGKKIFEGDIVVVNIKGYNTICKVAWADTVAQFQLWQTNTIPNTPTILNLGNYDCEIIGNIHDNPELLKGGVDNGCN